MLDEERLPPVPDVVVEVPKNICWPEFCAIVHPRAVFIPVTSISVPTAAVVGSVSIRLLALLAI
jgi:hypothetical protein